MKSQICVIFCFDNLLQRVPFFFFTNVVLFQEDLGVKNSFLFWYIYAITEAIISDVLIPIGVFIYLR